MTHDTAPSHASAQASLRHRLSWMEWALCAQVDPELFFPEYRANAVAAAARRICATCPVRAECLRYALTDPDLDGIWGGTTPRQRQRLRGTPR